MRPRFDEVTPDSIAAGLAYVRERIAAAAAVSGRTPDAVRIVAAVKYVDAQACAQLVDAGVLDLAESRLEQLVDRQAAGVVDDAAATWHFIGRLQSRQAEEVAARVQVVHTLCSDRAARRLARHATDGGLLPELLVQVNVADDPAKDGLAPEEVEPFLQSLPEELVVTGFMAMPPAAEDPEQSRPAFAALRELRDELRPRLAGRHDLRRLSIGTSQDFTVAVEEGATDVRLGRILYGGAE